MDTALLWAILLVSVYNVCISNDIIKKEKEIMSIGQDVLDHITAQGTTIASIKALLDAWVADGSITPEQRAAINAAFAANDSKLAEIETALQPTPTP